jgi:hypothetical protein
VSVFHYSALKISLWIVASLGVLAAALVIQAPEGMSTAVWVALIAAIASLLVAIITGMISIYLQRQTGKTVSKVEIQTNSTNSELRKQRNEAAARGDTAVGAEQGRLLARAEAAEDKEKP